MRLSTQVPNPIVYTTVETLNDANNSTGVNGARLAKVFATGQTSLSSKFNYNSKLLELIGRYGCGAFAILNGLGLTYTLGLTLTIGSGQALCEGVVEKLTSSTLVLPNNKANLYIWLNQDGSLTYVDNSLTPPYTRGVFLGTVTTSAGNITSVDTAGVVYMLAGGVPWRQVGDSGAPASTPPNMYLITQTALLSYISTSSSSGYIPWLTNEAVQDVVGAMLTASGSVTPTYDDTAGTMSFTINGTAITQTIQDGHFTVGSTLVTITAHRTLSSSDKNVQAIVPSGGNFNVVIAATPVLGMEFRIIHAGTANSLIAKVNTTTLATLTSGQVIEVKPGYSSGSLSWPTTVTPVAS